MPGRTAFGGFTAILTILAITAACTPIRNNENVTDGAGDDPIVRKLAAELALPGSSPAEEIKNSSFECDKIGGSFSRQGRAGNYLCVLSYSDAGKICASKGDCVARCLAPLSENSGAKPQGKCETNTSPFGCFSVIDAKGVVGPALCVD
jgi:hypothetical protein